MTNEQANKIANRWIDLWNNKSLEEYLSQFTDDVELVSSVALRLFPDSNGKLTNKKLLFEYWSLVKANYPEYRFYKLNEVQFKENKVIMF
jgi:hypothetical protein